MKDAVKDLDPPARLSTALDVIRQGLDTEEHSQEVVAEVWKLVLQEEWWRAQHDSLEGFLGQCGMFESIEEVVQARLRTERLKRKFAKMAADSWGGGELETIMGGDLMPLRPSKHFLEWIKSLAREVRDVNVAKELLLRARDHRLTIRGASKDTRLRVQDIEVAIRELKVQGPPQASQIEAMREDNAEGSQIEATGRDSDGQSGGWKPTRIQASDDESLSGEGEEFEWEETQRDKGWSCGCQDEEVARVAEAMVEGMKGKDLGDKVSSLEGVTDWIWSRMCFRHIKLITSGLELQTRILSRIGMMERLGTLQDNKGRTDELVREERTREWFRMSGRPAHSDDSLGPFRFHAKERKEFSFDEDVVWKRFASGQAKEKFVEDGNVVITGVFDWIFEDAELMGMVNVEFEMYRYHLREQNGKSNWGWCRNMWYSLVQQVMRQDPVFYALNVAARPDQMWRLVSYPYYTKSAVLGDRTEFRHVDLNIPRFLSCGRGGNLVQSAISIDDEEEDGCTIIVPGFHRHVREWWDQVVDRKEDKDGLIHSVQHIYKDVDEVSFGTFKPVVCKRGDVRLTLPQIIHGSTGCPRQRRVIFPWLMAVQENGKMELEECGIWNDVATAHRRMEAIKRGPSGKCHQFSLGSRQFDGGVEIRGVTALGDALVGTRDWDSRAVLMERDTILGKDKEAAWKMIEGGRREMKRAWKDGFEKMMTLEMEVYGDNSYFRYYGLTGLSG
jgi:hypothetical protein